MKKVKAYMGNGAYIFISYSHKDADVVIPIIEQLQKNGYNVWFDEGIKTGKEWPEFVAEQVMGCSCFIGMISENSVQSKECRNEIFLADAENKNLFTILLESTKLTPGLKMKLATVQAIFKYNYQNVTDFYIKLLENEEIQKCKGDEEFQIFENRLIRYHGQLENIVIPEQINEIGFNAFEGCNKIRTINIQKNVRKIGKYAFYNCNGLFSFDVETNNEDYSSQNGVLFNKSGAIIICFPPCRLEKIYQLKSGVKRIHAFAFQNAHNLIEVKIPETVTAIDEQAFENCSSLLNIQIPQKINQIPNKCFRGCVKLLKIQFPEALQKIDSNAFAGCGNLLAIDLPHNLSELGMMSFAYCHGIKKISMPNQLKIISDYAFYDCSDLVEIDFNNVEIICDYAFKYCTSITSLNFPIGLQEIGFAAFSRNDSIKEIMIPDSVKQIGGYCFDYGLELVTVNIGHGVSKIEEGTFYSCPSLKEVTFTNSLTHIGLSAFGHCPNLRKINFKGTLDEWRNIEIAQNNTALSQAEICLIPD